MEKERLFLSEDNTMVPTWNSSSKIQPNELNCASELPNCFFNPDWENSMDQSDPFESALSSMVSSPVTSHATGVAGGRSGDGVVLKELIGRLGSICNSGEISPQSYIGGNNSTSTSCYNTPLNSPPKLNLSIPSHHQIRGNFSIPEIQLPSHPSLTPFSSDPGFADRAARFSCFSTRNFCGLNGQFGLNESDFPHRLAPRVESGNISRVSSRHSFKISASPMDVQDNKDFLSKDRNSESMEESSVSEQIPDGDIGLKSQTDANARKRKFIGKGKAKEIPSSSPATKDSKQVGGESYESSVKRNKQDESSGSEEDGGGIGNQKKTKESAKPPEPPKDYIHVRARRGQATDSHSLAERVRREKISERMKFLQDLVPGCNKVTGKAVMLDEIINYVQSLQRQVEFLSMKLSSVHPRMEFSMETLLSKDILSSRGGSVPNNLHPLETTSLASSPYGFHSAHVGGIPIPNPIGTDTPFTLAPLNSTHWRNSIPPISAFGEALSQASAFWVDDLQSVVQMGFGQNQEQIFHAGTAQMKIEP